MQSDIHKTYVSYININLCEKEHLHFSFVLFSSGVSNILKYSCRISGVFTGGHWNKDNKYRSKQRSKESKQILRSKQTKLAQIIFLVLQKIGLSRYLRGIQL